MTSEANLERQLSNVFIDFTEAAESLTNQQRQLLETAVAEFVTQSGFTIVYVDRLDLYRNSETNQLVFRSVTKQEVSSWGDERRAEKSRMFSAGTRALKALGEITGWGLTSGYEAFMGVDTQKIGEERLLLASARFGSYSEREVNPGKEGMVIFGESVLVYEPPE